MKSLNWSFQLAILQPFLAFRHFPKRLEKLQFVKRTALLPHGKHPLTEKPQGNRKQVAGNAEATLRPDRYSRDPNRPSANVKCHGPKTFACGQMFFHREGDN